ncbi:MAG: hypothetical protein AVDCRST_MAG08-4094, partial [uncultured Acetobacteraceae bacterium]
AQGAASLRQALRPSRRARRLRLGRRPGPRLRARGPGRIAGACIPRQALRPAAL